MAAAESQSLSTYLPVLVQVVLGLSIPAIILAVSHLFGQRAKGNYIKDKAYECGLPMEGKPHPRFAVKFYVTAMLFILFDIEIVFLYPLAVILEQLGWFGFVEFGFFIGILGLAYVYIWRKGALEWR
jgi:NADH-quinone oxidoreductase subunit A